MISEALVIKLTELILLDDYGIGEESLNTLKDLLSECYVGEEVLSQVEATCGRFYLPSSYKPFMVKNQKNVTQ